MFYALSSLAALRDTTQHIRRNNSAVGLIYCAYLFLHLFVFMISDLDKGEGRSGAEGLRFMLHLVLDVLLHALQLVDLLFLLHAEEDA